MTEYNGNTRNSQSKNWRSDPRLHNMDPAKIALLASFADELMKTPDNRKMQAFLSPAERQKAEMIRRLAGRLQNPP